MFNLSESEQSAVLSRNLEASIRQRSLVLLVLSGLSVTVILYAQESEQRGRPSAEAASNVSSLRVNTRLVEVNVIVNDKHGNPVPRQNQEHI